MKELLHLAKVFPLIVCLLAAPAIRAADLAVGGGSEETIALAGEIESDLADGGGKYSLSLHAGGGTSAYAVVQREGQGVLGALIPNNSANYITGEVNAWSLGRALGCAELFQPAVRVSLRGKGLQTFRTLLRQVSYKGNKEQNRVDILKQIEHEPDALPVAFKRWAQNKKDYPIEVGNTLNTRDTIARYLRSDAPEPTDVTVTIRGATATQRDLARQLSNIFLVDALCGQWDRFSGGNLHTNVQDGHVQFMALDNGGASITGPLRYTTKYTNLVSRFDKDVADRLLGMDALLNGGHEFAGFTDAHAFAEAVGCQKPREQEFLAKRVHLVAAHVRETIVKPHGTFE